MPNCRVETPSGPHFLMDLNPDGLNGAKLTGESKQPDGSGTRVADEPLSGDRRLIWLTHRLLAVAQNNIQRLSMPLLAIG